MAADSLSGASRLDWFLWLSVDLPGSLFLVSLSVCCHRCRFSSPTSNSSTSNHIHIHTSEETPYSHKNPLVLFVLFSNLKTD
jgi:hypothetical protein